MTNQDHGAYYQHLCTHCGSCTFEALPMLACPRCHAALPDECVSFDHHKRAADLAQRTGCTVASDMGATT